MVRDQADELRRLARLASKPSLANGPAPRLIGVSGGGRGAGATTIAVNLTVAQARLGHRALWIDADLAVGGGPRWGASPRTGVLIDVLAGQRTIHEALQRGPAGIQVLAGGWPGPIVPPITPAAEQRFVDDLQHLGLHADVIVLDLGSGDAQFSQRIRQAVDLLLLVAGHDAAAIVEAYAAIKLLIAGESAPPVQLLVNRADADQAAEVQRRVAGACQQFLGLRLNDPFYLPEHPRIADAQVAGMSFLWPSIGGEAAECMERWAEEAWSRMRGASLRANEKRRAA